MLPGVPQLRNPNVALIGTAFGFLVLYDPELFAAAQSPQSERARPRKPPGRGRRAFSAQPSKADKVAASQEPFSRIKTILKPSRITSETSPYHCVAV